MYLVHVHLEFDKLFEELGREANVYNCLLFSRLIIEVYRVLLKILPLLENNIRIELWVSVLVRVAAVLNLRHQHVSTFARHWLEFEARINLIIWNIIIIAIFGILL